MFTLDFDRYRIKTLGKWELYNQKLDPGDIDLLVSFDGLKMDDDSTYNEIEDLSDDIKMKDEYECHTFCFAKYPPDLGILYKNYKDNIDTYIKIWKTDKHDCSDEKGLIEFNKDEINKIRSLKMSKTISHRKIQENLSEIRQRIHENYELQNIYPDQRSTYQFKKFITYGKRFDSSFRKLLFKI